jgi:excinuclease UvrABC nuclease subunit
VRQRGAAATVGLFGFGFGAGGGDNDSERKNWLRVLQLRARLLAAVEQEQYQGAARLQDEIHKLLSQETDALVRRLSAAAAEANRNMKRIRRRGDANLEKLRLDLDTAVVEEDFAMAAQLRDEIRALEALKTVGNPDHTRRSVSEEEMTYLLNDLLPQSISELRSISALQLAYLLSDLKV